MKVLSLRFSKAYKTYEEWAIPQRQSALILRSLKDLEGSLVDIGCGTGFASQGLKNVLGVDIALGMAKVYKERFGRVVVGDAHHLPFKDKSFDYSLSNFSLHWTDIERSIGEAVRVCRKGFLCALPVEGSLPEFGFPFPKAQEVLKVVKEKADLREYFTEELPVPFKGFDLVRFFHYTGSSYNPALKGGIISKRELEGMTKRIDSPKFVVLFFYCEVKK